MGVGEDTYKHDETRYKELRRIKAKPLDVFAYQD